MSLALGAQRDGSQTANIANGLDMKPGDEVLMTDQEHPGGEHPWNCARSDMESW